MKITVITHPNARRERVEADLLGQVHVHVTAPAVDGKANQAVLDVLSKHFRKKKGNILLLHGEKSKVKVFEIK